MQTPTLFRARAAWTGECLIDNPAILMRDGRIDLIDRSAGVSRPANVRVVDFGDSMLMPGFINAHCHLEYSCLLGFLPPGKAFPEWLAAVAKERHARPEEEFADGVQRGVLLAKGAGTTAILDIFTRDTARETLAACGLRAWSFLESIRLDPNDAGAQKEGLVQRLGRIESTPGLLPGLSPHAPYTVSAPLARLIAALARERDLPLAIHLAETPEEREMLETGRGPLAQTFRHAGLLPDNWRPPGLSPVVWAENSGLLDRRTLIIHGNYLEDREIALLAARGVSVAFCPKTHTYFRHEPHPLPRMLAAGINVCIGTDSLASNDSLDLLSELREARRQFPNIPARALFAMIGANVARFLGCGEVLGTLRPGAWCDITIISPAPSPNVGAEDALETILRDPYHTAAGGIVKKGVRNLFA